MADSPHTVLNADDPGDDTQRRLRFQATSAAIWSLALYDDAAGLQAIYCEHHEDVLFHKTGDRFIGTQVKSKLDHLGPHRAQDEEIAHSIRRFVHLERTFPTYFDGYQISSNAGFWNESKSGANLPHILAAAKNDSLNGDCPKAVKAYLGEIFPPPAKPKVSKKKTKKPEEIAAEESAIKAYEADLADWESTVKIGRVVLKKTETNPLHRMAEARIVLINMLPKCALVGDRLHSELGTIADALIAEMLKAASLTHESTKDRYLFVFDKPDEITASEILDGKRITCDRLKKVVESCIKAVPTLVTNAPITVDDLPSGLRVMELKMATGGLSITNIDLAKDLKASTEALLLRWLHQEGKGATDQRYQHLRTLVRNEAQEAYDAAETEDTTFGPAMLTDIRQRLRQKYDDDPSAFFGCTYEHLLGMTGILTEDCTLWWSKPFEIPPVEVAT